MAIFYRKYKNNNEKVGKFGKWYARAVATQTIDTKKLSQIMQRNCTVKSSDVKAVIDELVETMRDQLQDSKRVKIDGLGSFKLVLSSSPADTAAAFDSRKNIKSVRVMFTPEPTVDATGNRTKTLLEGITVMELPKNSIDDEDAQDGNGGE